MRAPERTRTGARDGRASAMRGLAPEFPFAPDRLPFFYGWAIAAVATVGVLMSIPGQTMGVSVFTDALIAATGLSRLDLANAYLIGTLLSGSCLPRAGVLLDRFGSRLTVVAASLTLGATLAYLSQVDRAATWLGARIGQPRAAALALVGLGFFALRFSGQGVLTLVGRTVVARWFDRLRGPVSGFQGPFISLGFSVAPLVLSAWIARAGWRGAWIEMALVVGIGMSLLGWLVYRDDPEACGLRMDGATRRPDAEPAAEHGARLQGHLAPSDVGEPEYSRGQALRTIAFWAFSLGLATQGLNVTAVTFHIVDLGRSQGLSQTEAVAIFPFVAGASVVTALAVGWLTNRWPLRWLLAGMMGFQGIGMLAFGYLAHPLGYALAALGIGVSGGCFGPLSSVPLPRYFGRRHLGAIQSVMLMCIVWGSALGPSLLALSLSVTQSYRAGLGAGAVLSTLALALACFASPPPHAPAPSGSRAS